MKVAIIRAGNGGQTFAGYLSKVGFETSLYDIDVEKSLYIRSTRNLWIMYIADERVKSMVDNENRFLLFGAEFHRASAARALIIKRHISSPSNFKQNVSVCRHGPIRFIHHHLKLIHRTAKCFHCRNHKVSVGLCPFLGILCFRSRIL